MPGRLSATRNSRSRTPPQERKNPGDDLFSRKAALSVSSALESLTSVFGMGTGVASPLESPGFPAYWMCFGCAGASRIVDPGLRGADRLRSSTSESVGITDSQPLTPGQLL